jgi:hypothetical protein
LAANCTIKGSKTTGWANDLELLKYIKITVDDGTLNGTPGMICWIFLCWHKSHQSTLEADGALQRGCCCYEEDGDDISSISML